MSSAAPAFNTDAIGAWTEPFEFEVTRERIKQYAEATNDPLAPHAAGELAPPVFAAVPAFGIAGQAALKVIPAELVMMIVHGQQDFHFHAPIVPGMTVTTRAAAIGLAPRSSGVTVTVKADTRERDGKLLVEQYMTSFVRGAQAPQAIGEPAPPHPLDEALRSRAPLAQLAQTFDADQTYRYAAASGDPMPIHLDAELARSVGLPGIIIHGLCTMAFVSVAVIRSVCESDPMRLRRLAVRFAKPVMPSQTITTRIWSAGGAAYAFETESDEGAVVLRDGLAEVRDGRA